MSYQRLAYEDADNTVQMHTDCDAAATEIGTIEQRSTTRQFSALAAESAAIDRTSEINVSEATAKFGSSHLD